MFEFGSGNSTLYWASVAARTTAVEHDKGWFDQVKARIAGANASVLLAADGHGYVDSILRQADKFDLVVVDGEYRAACATSALAMLKDDGMVILDNADWHSEAADILRKGGLLEVDFSGFGPLNDYTWTTSLFFKREFVPVFVAPNHPLPGLGGIAKRGVTVHAP